MMMESTANIERNPVERCVRPLVPRFAGNPYFESMGGGARLHQVISYANI